VPTVFPQVRRNAIRSSRFTRQGGGKGVGLIGLSRLSHSGDVVNVDAETKGQHRRKGAGGRQELGGGPQ